MKALSSAIATLLILVALPTSSRAAGSFIGSLTNNNQVATTVPGNGDVNPYGVAVVPRSVGKLVKGHVLVSNFNAVSQPSGPGGFQGTGTTIVDVAPSGSVT